MKKIYVVGSLNMDLVINTPYLPQKGETMFGNDFFSNCGGKGLNQAIAIAKLGGNVEMIGCVGDDEFGKQLIQNLLTCGAQTQNISVVKNVSTGTAIILVCDCDNRIILDAGANSELTFEAVKSGLVNANKGDLLICQMEIPLEVVKQTIIYAKSIGLFTILNPSPARKLDSELLQKIDLLVPNETELQALTDTDSIQQGISNLLELGAKEVIVTVGSKGSVVVSEGQSVFVDAIKVNAIDTTAAGDTFLGGVAVKLAEGENLINSAKYATKASAITVTRKGASCSIPIKEEVDNFQRL